MATTPEFSIEVPPESELGKTLVVGIADFGMAGLTAVDYLAKHLDTRQVGHVSSRNLPDLLPFAEGVPRHPMRFYSTESADLSLFVSEVFLPVWVADRLAEAVFDWLTETSIEAVTVLFGAQFPHAEEEHVVFHVGNDSFRTEHVGADTGIAPLRGGFFDGIVGELLTQGLAEEDRAVGSLVTPAHHPGPDLDGALRLIGAVESVYGIEVDESDLREGSEQMRQQYEELAKRMEALRQNDGSLRNRDFPDDRMFM